MKIYGNLAWLVLNITKDEINIDMSNQMIDELFLCIEHQTTYKWRERYG